MMNWHGRRRSGATEAARENKGDGGGTCGGALSVARPS